MTNRPREAAARLMQDPHALRETREKSLEAAIGPAGARAAPPPAAHRGQSWPRKPGLSAGMLSKIENGLISPSLGTPSGAGPNALERARWVQALCQTMKKPPRAPIACKRAGEGR
jgi:hypothetical protein